MASMNRADLATAACSAPRLGSRPYAAHGRRLSCFRSLVVALGLSVVVATAGCERRAAEAGQPVAESVEKRPPNARDQRPAFPGQTRAPARSAGVAFDVRSVTKGLEHPWALAFLPDGQKLVTERPGRMRIVGAGGALSPPLAGVPRVDARGQGGLLDVALDPSFAENRRVYFCFAEPRDGGNGTALARARLVSDAPNDAQNAVGAAPAPTRLDGVEVIWRQTPTLASTLHFGCRIVFEHDARGAPVEPRRLFVALGERSILEGRRQAQRLDGTLGKVVRLDENGKAADGNPFAGREGALPEIWSIGHRNLQAAALHPETQALWVVDHGPRGGDEVNIVERGKDYGWPTVTYGEEYQGGAVGEGKTQAPGTEQPLYYWDPSIAPSGMAFYVGDRFPEWRGSLLVGALAGRHIARLTLEGARVVGEERLLEGRARIRDVRVGPDGLVYALTDEDDGELLVLVPRER
jgi:glucose/arabinose dehydrogenase